MSFAPWITVNVDDVRVHLPMSIHDKDIRIMFRNAEVIDETIKQLEELKKYMIKNDLAIR